MHDPDPLQLGIVDQQLLYIRFISPGPGLLLTVPYGMLKACFPVPDMQFGLHSFDMSVLVSAQLGLSFALALRFDYRCDWMPCALQ
jgi:hypothetical protein